MIRGVTSLPRYTPPEGGNLIAMATSSRPGPIICAWCEAALQAGNLKSPLSHGICLACMAAANGDPVEDLSDLEPQVFEALPFGAIQLAGDGTIVAYNRAESVLSGLGARSGALVRIFSEMSHPAPR